MNRQRWLFLAPKGRLSTVANPDPAPAAPVWKSLAAADDPLVRMPGTQPDQDVHLDGLKRGQIFRFQSFYFELTPCQQSVRHQE